MRSEVNWTGGVTLRPVTGLAYSADAFVMPAYVCGQDNAHTVGLPPHWKKKKKSGEK